MLPQSALAGAAGLVGIPLAHPELVHRVELVHGALTGAAADLVETLMAPAS